MTTLEDLLSQETMERLGWTLIHFVWQATAVALLLATVLRLLRQRSTEARYIASCLALALIVALPLLTLSLVKVPGPTAEAGPVASVSPVVGARPVETIELAELPAGSLDEQSLPPAAPVARTPWTQRAAAGLEPTLPYLVAGWLLGVFGLSAWHLGGWAQLHGMKRRMIHETAPSLRAQFAVLSKRLGICRTVALLESALVEVPTVVGWIKPVILLPASVLTGLSAEQLEAVLAHELAHVRRHDYLVNLVQTVVEILGFYHPAVWWVSHRIRDERENCCDDLAVQVCGDSIGYARALARLEEMRHCRTELAVAASGGSLVARIGRLLGRPATTNRRITWLPGLIALLLVALIIVPATLVLATPARSQRSTPPTAGPTASESSKRPQEPRQILLSYIITEIATETALDHETAALARNLFFNAATHSEINLPTVEEVQKMLPQLLRDYAKRSRLAGDGAKALTDLLTSRGYARLLNQADTLTREGTYASITTGDDPNQGASDAARPTRDFRLSIEVTPTLQDDPNMILAALGFHAENLVFFDSDGRLRAKAGTASFRTTAPFRVNEYTMFPLPVGPAPESPAPDAETTMLLLLIRLNVLADGEPGASSPGTGKAEQTESFHTNEKGQVDRRFSFERLVHTAGDRGEVAYPRVEMSQKWWTCTITADWAEAQMAAAPGRPAPGRFAFRGNVVISIARSGPDRPALCVLHLDDVTSANEAGRLFSSGPVRCVFGDTELIARGFELRCNPTLDRPEGACINAIDGVDLYITPTSSLIVALGNHNTDPDARTEGATGPGTRHIEKSLPAEQLIAARREYVRSDPMVSELLEKIAEVEIDLVSARQNLLPGNREIVQKKQQWKLPRVSWRKGSENRGENSTQGLPNASAWHD